ncbi:hypothetical protein Syun_011660 [Stephania yunnanensis]|uniref:Uncharacterized protein n=1 Tax=Stephania yunnanensis TaxID=152371 RepID=A0AAP0K067_9MAGN
MQSEAAIISVIVVTNDGNAILRELDLAHPNLLRQSMIELSRTQDEEVGDGTTSVIILGIVFSFQFDLIANLMCLQRTLKLLRMRGRFLDRVAMSIDVNDLPQIFSSLKCYHVLVMPFCNAYGVGLTDFLLVILANNGGVLAGLAACGVTMDIIATVASDLMQDFKTSYCLTLASPMSMFVRQVIGTAMGCVISSCVCWIFIKAFKGIGEIGFRVSGSLCACFLQHSDIRCRGPFSTS